MNSAEQKLSIYYMYVRQRQHMRVKHPLKILLVRILSLISRIIQYYSYI